MLQKARIKLLTRVLYRLTYFFLNRQSSSAGKWKVVVIAVFLSKLDQATVQLCILRDYCSVRIGYNMINKHHTLSILYTVLVQIRYVSIIVLLREVFIVLLRVNEVCGNNLWFLKWVNWHCNWINLISVLNFP